MTSTTSPYGRQHENPSASANFACDGRKIPPKPETLPLLFDNLPEYIRERGLWARMIYEWEAKPSGEIVWKKTPRDRYGAEVGTKFTADRLLGPDALRATPFDAAYWTDVAPHPRVVCVDLDHATDARGNVLPWAQAVIDRFSGAYIERSPSGTGIHILVLCTMPSGPKGQPGKRQRLRLPGFPADAHIDVLPACGFISMTGQVVQAGEIIEAQTAVEALIAECDATKGDPRGAGTRSSGGGAGSGSGPTGPDSRSTDEIAAAAR